MVFNENPEQEIWPKTKKTRKNGQHNKDLISLFALFFKASVTNQMSRGDDETHSCRRS